MTNFNNQLNKESEVIILNVNSISSILKMIQNQVRKYVILEKFKVQF